MTIMLYTPRIGIRLFRETMVCAARVSSQGHKPEKSVSTSWIGQPSWSPLCLAGGLASRHDPLSASLVDWPAVMIPSLPRWWIGQPSWSPLCLAGGLASRHDPLSASLVQSEVTWLCSFYFSRPVIAYNYTVSARSSAEWNSDAKNVSIFEQL